MNNNFYPDREKEQTFQPIKAEENQIDKEPGTDTPASTEQTAYQSAPTFNIPSPFYSSGIPPTAPRQTLPPASSGGPDIPAGQMQAADSVTETSQNTPMPSSSYRQSPNHTYPQFSPYAPYGKNAEPATPASAKKEKKKRRWPKAIAAMLAVIVVSGTTSAGVTSYLLLQRDDVVATEPDSRTESSTADNLKLSNAVTSLNNISDVVALVTPTVVEVSTEYKTTHPLFGDLVSGGAGSGVIISEDGYIVTNNHVVEDASTFQVRTSDGEIYDAELIGRDVQTDLAVLKIDATGLASASFADSDLLKVGDLAIAVGNPLGTLGGTVTDGIISALNREIEIEGQKMTLIQTSAALNHGNSGGGLFDAGGNLVGIVNAKSTGTGVEGLGFAIPSNLAEEVISQIVKSGYVTGRPQLGITVVEIQDLAAANYYGVKEHGVYVNEVLLDNGLAEGDRIITMDGSEIKTFEDIKNFLETKKANDKITIEVMRENKTLVLKVTLSEKLPDHIEAPSTTPTGFEE